MNTPPTHTGFPITLEAAFSLCPPRGQAVVYFLRLRSGALYIGASLDLVQRLHDHASGRACQTTADDPPQQVLRVEPWPAFTEARTREAQRERWSRAKKEALVHGDPAGLRRLARSREKQ